MKKLKLSDSELRLLLMLLALIMISGAYFLSFQKNVTQAQEIEAQNEEDQETVRTLEAMVGSQKEKEEEIEEFHRIVTDIIAKYPPDVTTEKAIMIVQGLEDVSGVEMTNISFIMNNLIGNIATNAGAAEETAAGAPVGYYATLGMTYEADYASFKQMVSYINGLEDRTTIPAVTAAYDNETGNLSGVITVNMYYLTNTGREYEAPQVTGIEKGVDNIFRSGGTTGEVAEDGEEQE